MSDNPKCPLCGTVTREGKPSANGVKRWQCDSYAKPEVCPLECTLLTLAEIERLKAGLTDMQIAAGLKEFEKSRGHEYDPSTIVQLRHFDAFRRGAYGDQERKG